jgi:hypothetical protein
MATEFEHSQNINNSGEPALTPEGRLLKEIREYYENIRLGTTPFKAVSDFADRKEAEFYGEHLGIAEDNNAQLTAIKETIRQRRNDIPGYDLEIGIAERFYRNLFSVMYNAEETRGRAAFQDRLERVTTGEIPVDIAVFRNIKGNEISRSNNRYVGRGRSERSQTSPQQ